MKDNQTKDKIIETAPPCLKTWSTPEINEISVLNTSYNAGGTNEDGGTPAGDHLS